MRKRRILAAALAFSLLLGVPALAAGGSASDPLLSLSYLNSTIRSSLQDLIQTWVSEDTESLYQEAETKVDALGNTYLTEAAQWSSSTSYEPLELKRGDTVTLSVGSGLLWLNGRGVGAEGLVDVTDGAELLSSSELTTNHRYLAAAEDGVTLTILSDAAALAVEGRWRLVESDEEELTSFYDLTQSTDWYYNAAYFAVQNGLFNGISDTRFSPLSGMRRSMVAAVLYRMEGEPQMEYSGVFTDVPAGSWFTAAVEWAQSFDLVKGGGDGTYRPDAYMTRQDLTLVIYRYAGEYLGLDVSQRGDLSSLADSDQIGAWAREAVSWGLSIGLYEGFDGFENGILAPRTIAARAEVASVLYKLSLWMELPPTA